MGFQDEFARRPGDARGVASGEGGEESRHPEFISGPPEANTEDGGKSHGVLKRVQDDGDMRDQGEDGGTNASRHAELDSASRAA
ncbi:MAG: hypothetical protein WBM39_13590, partial [Parasphingorhabdus sp.]